MKKITILLVAIFTLSKVVNAQWTEVNSDMPNAGISTDVESFAAIGTQLLAATNTGVYLTNNNGSSWSGVNSGITNTDIEALAAIGTKLFAGTGNGIFKSNDNGSTWTSISTGLDISMGTSVYSLFASGTNLFAGTEAGVALSAPPYTSWTMINTGLTKTDVYAFAQIGNNIFAGILFSGVFVTNNNGGSWTAVNSGLPTGFNSDFESFAVSGPNLFAADLGGGIFLSTNNGTSWTGINTGLTELSVHALAISGQNIFAGTDAGVFLSNNNGGSWVQMNIGLTNLTVQSLTIFGTYLFAGTTNGVFRASLNSFVGINEMQNENMQVSIYPNPSNGIFTITSNKIEKTKIEIYNSIGECILNRELTKGTDDINLSDLPNGIYSIKLTGENWTEHKKIIKG